MINSYDQLIDKLDKLNLGPNIVHIEVSSTSVSLTPPESPAKDELNSSGHWLDASIRQYLRKRINIEDRRWVLKNDVLVNVKKSILVELMAVIAAASDTKMPERTTIYKEFRTLNDKYGQDKPYLDSIIQIINYYHGAKTDPTSKSNVIGLLNILRKRYNGKSSNRASGTNISDVPF